MLQVADRERCLAGRDYDDRDVNVVGQLDVVVWRLHVVYIKTVYDGGEYSTVSHASGHAISTCERCFFLEGCFDRQTIQVRMDYFCKIRVLVDRDMRWALFNS